MRTLLTFLSAFQLFSVSAFSAWLEWDASTTLTDGTPSLASGYRAYVGPSSRAYDRSVDVATNLSWRLDCAPGTTNFFAVTAYGADGLESEFSDEVSYVMPPARQRRQLALRIGADVVTVETSNDAESWFALAVVPFSPTNGPQFFRTKE